MDRILASVRRGGRRGGGDFGALGGRSHQFQHEASALARRKRFRDLAGYYQRPTKTCKIAWSLGTGRTGIKRAIKRLVGLVTCVSGVPLLMIARESDDVIIRTLATVAGICLIISGGLQLWLLPARRKKTGDDLAY